MHSLAQVHAAEVDAFAKLRAELEQIHDADQKGRHLISQYINGPQRDSVLKVMIKQDAANRQRVFAILDSAGWLSIEEVGAKAHQALFLVVQHSDADPPAQAHYLEMLREAVAAGRARTTELAYLEDRVAVNNGRPQIYGTQVGYKNGRNFFEEIQDEANVNERRKQMGLEPLEIYAEQFGIEWSSPAVQERVILSPSLGGEER